MTTEDTEIRVINGALDESSARGGTIILRGVIHPESLELLKVDDYQRERKPASAQASIWSALKTGETLPDIELGMRGQRFKQAKDGTIYLQDPVFIIDGLQRQTTAMRFIDEVGGSVRLGAVIHFDTDKGWERERFRILNTTQGKVSGNVLLRNQREVNPAILTMYGLTTNTPTFPLYKRVSWSQTFGRNDLVGALVLCRAALDLHNHLGRRGGTGAAALQVATAIDAVGKLVSLTRLRANMAEFFSVIDEGWPIRQIDNQSPSPFLRGGFLFALARVFSHHRDFWTDEDRVLDVDLDLRRKIARFPVFDPNMAHLTQHSNASGVTMLARHIVDHINSGKRTKRLTPRSRLTADETDTPEAA